MRELFTLGIISTLFLVLFIVTLFVGIMRRNRSLKKIAFLLLTCFFVSAAWTGLRFVKKSYNNITATLRPRTGIEIYNALFGPDKSNCVKVTASQDQVIPIMDDAIWLRFESCPPELKRILSIHEFHVEKQPLTFFGEKSEWADRKIMGDTLLVFQYWDESAEYMQTLWTSTDSTKVICRDVYY